MYHGDGVKSDVPVVPQAGSLDLHKQEERQQLDCEYGITVSVEDDGD